MAKEIREDRDPNGHDSITFGDDISRALRAAGLGDVYTGWGHQLSSQDGAYPGQHRTRVAQPVRLSPAEETAAASVLTDFYVEEQPGSTLVTVVRGRVKHIKAFTTDNHRRIINLFASRPNEDIPTTEVRDKLDLTPRQAGVGLAQVVMNTERKHGSGTVFLKKGPTTNRTHNLHVNLHSGKPAA